MTKIRRENYMLTERGEVRVAKINCNLAPCLLMSGYERYECYERP